jgi:DNA-binding response OmpR family regulator
MGNKKILLVEDEADISDLLCLHLRDIASDVVVAADGYAGMRLARAGSWDMIILDLRDCPVRTAAKYAGLSAAASPTRRY